MERFIDRLRGGKLRPYAPDVLADPVEHENRVREQISEEFSLTVANSASSEKSLGIMLGFAVLGLPFVLTYTATIYWVFRGKVKITPASY